jgi:uncharacterized membrane protein YhdT
VDYRKTIILSIIFGTIIGFVGGYITGFLDAIAIPKEFVQWFTDNIFRGSNLIVQGIAVQFIGFGILGIISGTVLARLKPSKWLLSSAICYLAFWSYFIILAYISGYIENISIAGMPWWLFVHMLVLPICLTMSAYSAAHRHNKSVKYANAAH